MRTPATAVILTHVNEDTSMRLMVWRPGTAQHLLGACRGQGSVIYGGKDLTT